MPKFHVTFKDKKKVLIIDKNEDFFSKFSQLFEVDHKPKALKLQMYDSEWVDYVDVEPEDLPEKAKVLVRLKTRQKVPNIPPPSYEASTEERVLFPSKPPDKTYNDCSIIGVSDNLNANKKNELLALAKLLQPSLQMSTRKYYEPLFNSGHLQISGITGGVPGQNSVGNKERDIPPLFPNCDEPLMRLSNAKDKTYSERVVGTRSQPKLIYPDSSNCIEKQNFSSKKISTHSELGTLVIRKNIEVAPLGAGLQQRTITRCDPQKSATTSFPYSQLLTAAAKYSTSHELASEKQITPDRTNAFKKVDSPQLGQSESLTDLLKGKKSVILPVASTCNSNSRTFAEYILMEGCNGPSIDDVFPQPFILPIEKFPWNLQAALDEKIILWKDAKHQLLQSLYDYISPYTVYPKPYMYEVACNSLIKVYPHLLDQCPMVLWRRMLSNKFRNERKRALQEHPSVIMNKRCTSQQTSDSRSATSQKSTKEPDDIEVIWPSPFRLSTKVFSKELLDAIATLDEPVSPKLQNLLLDELHKYVSTFAKCPNSYQCHEVASALLSTFRQISGAARKSGLSYYQAEKEWAKLISQKFGTGQKTTSTSPAEVMVKAEPEFLTSSYCDLTDSMSSSETSLWCVVQSGVADNGQQAESQEGESFLIQDKQISRSQDEAEFLSAHAIVKHEIDDPVENSLQLPPDLQLEKFSRYVLNSLAQQRMLTESLIGKIISTLFNYLSNYTLYPSEEQVTLVLNQLFEKFPYICSRKKYDDVMSTWSKMLLSKFRNENKRALEEPPSLIMNKRQQLIQSEENDVLPIHSRTQEINPQSLKTDVLWPKPFLLSVDIFSKELRERIDKLLGPASPHLIVSVLNELHTYVSMFSRTPSVIQLGEVISALLETFPKLLCDSENFSENKKKWVMLIATKFKRVFLNSTKVGLKTLGKRAVLTAAENKANLVTSSNLDLSDNTSNDGWFILEGDDLNEEVMTTKKGNPRKLMLKDLEEESPLEKEEVLLVDEVAIKEEKDTCLQSSSSSSPLPIYSFPDGLHEVLLQQLSLTGCLKGTLIVELIKFISTYPGYPNNVNLKEMLDDFFYTFPQDNEYEGIQKAWKRSLFEMLGGDKNTNLYQWMATEALNKLQDKSDDNLNAEGNNSWSSALNLLSEHFLAELKNALDSVEGQEAGDLMFKVLEELYEFVSKITRDPNPSQCKDAAAAVLDIFPKLKEGTTSYLAVTYWTGLIMRKFDMERGRRIIDDDDNQEVEEEKVTSSEDELHRSQIKLEDKTSSPSWSTGQGTSADDDSLAIILNS